MDLRYSREVTVGAIVIVAILVFIFGTMWLSGRSVSSGNTGADPVRQRERAQAGLAGAGLRGQRRQGGADRVRGRGQGAGDRRACRPRSRPGWMPRPRSSRSRWWATTRWTSTRDSAAEFLPPGKVILGTQDLGLSGAAPELSDRADSILIGAQAIVNQKTADQLTLHPDRAARAPSRRRSGPCGSTATPARGPTAELTRTMAAFRQLSARLDSTLANPGAGPHADRADTLTGNLAAMTAQLTATGARLDTLLAGMNRGQGTLGQVRHRQRALLRHAGAVASP